MVKLHGVKKKGIELSTMYLVEYKTVSWLYSYTLFSCYSSCNSDANLFSGCVHVPHSDAAVSWAWHQLPGQLEVTQGLDTLAEEVAEQRDFKMITIETKLNPDLNLN